MTSSVRGRLQRRLYLFNPFTVMMSLETLKPFFFFFSFLSFFFLFLFSHWNVKVFIFILLKCIALKVDLI